MPVGAPSAAPVSAAPTATVHGFDGWDVPQCDHSWQDIDVDAVLVPALAQSFRVMSLT
jgi:hypothetical protein